MILHNYKEIEGSKCFIVPEKNFMIEPLSADNDFSIVSLIDGKEEEEVIATLKKDEYTSVRNSTPGTIFRVNTDERFLVRW